jgi:undecaprenyl-diphosphatase
MEQKLLLLINIKWTTPALDLFMSIMSSFDLWLPLLVIAALAVAFWGGFRARAMLAVMVLTLIVVNTLAGPLKSLVHRPRPHEALAGVRQVELAHTHPAFLGIFKKLKIRISTEKTLAQRGNSFPSAHVLNNFSMAFLAAVFFRYGWLFYVPASLVGYSRIYVGSHFPSDVFVSALLGTGLAMLCLALAELLWRKFGGRFLPTIFATHPNLRQNSGA